jgi:hypothetical protein
MSIERTSEDHAQFKRDMKRIAQSKMTHTPGPWAIEDKGPVSGKFTIPIFATIRPGERWSVAHVNGVDSEAKANARLIAAAPELYVNLSGLLAWLDSAKRQDAEAWKWLPDEVYLKSTRAALAKAEGKEMP